MLSRRIVIPTGASHPQRGWEAEWRDLLFPANYSNLKIAGAATAIDSKLLREGAPLLAFCARSGSWPTSAFLAHRSTGRSNRDDEKTVFKELVPMLACLNSSKAGLSELWSSVVTYRRSL